MELFQGFFHLHEKSFERLDAYQDCSSDFLTPAAADFIIRQVREVAMKYLVERSKLSGCAEIPGSKSHTIRAVFFGILSGGESRIESPLESDDTHSAMRVGRGLGASFERSDSVWTVRGTGGKISGINGDLDAGNSGTTIRIALGAAALAENSSIILNGDDQIQRRPIGHLAEALNNLGANVECVRNNGCPPVRITRPMWGGSTPLRAPSSQFLTSLLISAPLAAGDTEINVLELNEKPYVGITMWWMDKLGVKYEHEGMDRFFIRGGQRIPAFARRIPGDFSSATFFGVAAAVTGSKLLLKGLDMSDVQGDKAVFDILREMGARIETKEDGLLVEGGSLRGGEFDLNATPDALPALAVAACAAEGETRLVNVPQARIKETDRIAVMNRELIKMGADVEELRDGLIVRGSPLKGAKVMGHSDHRVVMALAVAGLIADGRTEISTAEAAGVTFPNFAELMTNCGAALTVMDDR
jgi:3-phosphoshikimate 1-carboxyvinyltransferase